MVTQIMSTLTLHKILPFKKAMKVSSSSLSSFCGRQLQLQPCCLEYETFMTFAMSGSTPAGDRKGEADER